MKIGEITARSILTRTGIPGVDYCLNPYVGCGHGCVYCYATRSHTLAISHSRAHDPGDSILIRQPHLQGVDLSTVEAPLKRAEKSSGQLRLS